MHGKIAFKDLTQLAIFLKAFEGSTAIFTVQEVGREWVLEFTGGY